METGIVYREEALHVSEGLWSKSYRMFSRGEFYDPERNQFGTLRSFNRVICTGEGRFKPHFYKDLEIIIFPLTGTIEYADSKANRCYVREGEVLVVSAGSGIYFAVNSAEPNKEASYLKVWIMPRKKYLTPLYKVNRIDMEMLQNRFHYKVTPDIFDVGTATIGQDAWIVGCELDDNSKITYKKKSAQNGIFVRVYYGKVEIRGHKLGERDTIVLNDKKDVVIKGLVDSQFMLVEIPMDVTLYDTYDPIIIPPKM